MKIEEGDRLLDHRKNLISLIVNTQRTISKQEDLVRDCQCSKEKAWKDIEKFEGYIQDYREEILMLERQLESNHSVILKFWE